MADPNRSRDAGFTDRRDNEEFDHTIYRAEDRRAGIAGRTSQSDRTYDPARYRDPGDSRNETFDRNRDRNRTYSTDQGLYGRGQRDYGMGGYGVNSGFLSGAEYGGYGRGSDYGAFDRGSDLVYGSPFGQGSDSSRATPGHVGRGPKNYRRSDDTIREEVCMILERHPHVDATEIEVDVQGGVVTLRGTVANREQKRMAEYAMDRIRGILDVRNEISLAK